MLICEYICIWILDFKCKSDNIGEMLPQGAFRLFFLLTEKARIAYL